jgi:C1A family cysteine protease
MSNGTRKIKQYGWVRDLPDHRDFLFAAPGATLAALPPKADLRPKCPPVYDQGQLGSCTANAIAGLFQFDELKEEKDNPPVPSRLFIYYNERAIEGSVGTDSGAQLRDGIKTVVKYGVCPEHIWPYDISQFAVKPPAAAFQQAKQDRAINYLRIPQVLNQMKGCLASGFPFVFGFSVYESFEGRQVAQTGVMNLPESSEAVLGGHAVCAVGYDDSERRFTVRNSWGTGWGMQGYFTMPYAYMTDPNLASDFWTIRKVS